MESKPLDDYSLYREFQNLSLKRGHGSLSITEFVKQLYDKKRFDILISIHQFVDSQNNFLINHGYIDWTGQGDPTTEFYMDYENGRTVVKNALDIDVKFINSHRKKFIALQEELKQILDGVLTASKLNKNIANFYTDIPHMDSQEVYFYHDKLYHEANEELVIDNVHDALYCEELSTSDINEILQTAVSITEKEEEEDRIQRNKKIVDFISKIDKEENRPKGIPPFNLDKYLGMQKLLEEAAPHFKERADGKLIAMFAGDKTELLQERLSEVHLQIGEPFRNPATSVWHYTIEANSSSFRGLIYKEFVKYINSMLDGMGFIPRCAYCQTMLTPTNQQIRKLQEGKDVYCLGKGRGSCAEKGRIMKQNRKRSAKKLGEYLKANTGHSANNPQSTNYKKCESSKEVADFNSHKLNRHFNGIDTLSIEEQSNIIQQKINQSIGKGVK